VRQQASGSPDRVVGYASRRRVIPSESRDINATDPSTSTGPSSNTDHRRRHSGTGSPAVMGANGGGRRDRVVSSSTVGKQLLA
jgi:hypothetical protein